MGTATRSNSWRRNPSPQIGPRRPGRFGRIVLGMLVAASIGPPAACLAEDYKVLALDDCVTIALAEHPAIAGADAEKNAARQRVRQAFSEFLPKIDAEYSATRQSQTISALIRGPSSPITGSQTQIFSFYRGGFTGTQLLFDFGQVLNRTRSSKALADSADADSLTVQHDVVLSVKKAYYELIALRRLLDVARESEGLTRRHLEEAHSRYDIGVAPRFDVTQQEVQMANAELDRLVAENNVDLGRENLRNAMGLTGPLRADPDDRSLDYVRFEVSQTDAVDRGYENRPEIQSQAAKLQAQEQEISALRKDYLPAAFGVGNYFFTGNTRPEDEGWLLGASVRLSIFNGGLTTARVGEGRAELMRLEAELEELRQRIALEVRQSYLSLRAAEGSIRVSKKAVQQAAESLEIAQGRYSAGAGQILELSDAQTDLAEARGNHVRVLTVYWIAVAQLEHAMGVALATAN